MDEQQEMWQEPGMGPMPGMAEPPKKKKGCFFWGCLTVALLFVIIGGCTGIGYYYMLNTLTSTTPKEIPVYQAQPGEYEALQKRIAEFDGAKGQATLELTADDLNDLIAENPDLQAFKGKVSLGLEDDLATLEFSVPLDESPIPFTGGRYFNGTLVTKVSLVNGRLNFDPEKLTLHELDLPRRNAKDMMDSISQAFLEQPLADLKRKLRDYKSMEVSNGKLVVTK